MKPVFITIVGSKLYGCSTENSDTDFKGFGFNDIECILGLKTQDQQQYSNNKIGKEKIEGTVYDIKYFLNLCLKSNPTIIECAFSNKQFHLVSSSIGYDVCNFVTNNFLTKALFKPYNAYHKSQIRKLQTSIPIGSRKEGFEKYGYDLKFCFHAFRLARQCSIIMKEGILRPTLDEPDKIIGSKIRNGDYTKEEAISILERVDREMYEEYKISKLPEHANFNAINSFCIEIYKNYIDGKYDNDIKTDNDIKNVLTT